MHRKVCQGCGKTYDTPRPNQKWHSRACYLKHSEVRGGWNNNILFERGMRKETREKYWWIDQEISDEEDTEEEVNLEELEYAQKI